MMVKWNQNGEGYTDNTAGIAIQNVSRKERKSIMAMSNQSRGRQNRAYGETFEKWIGYACEYYWDKRWACIEKTPEPMKPLKPYERSRGTFVACFSKRAQPDFKGVLCDGSCIIFDAKHTEKDRISQSAVSIEQEKMFDRYSEMGAHCYVVVSAALQRFFRVPWNIWKNMKELYGRKYMLVETELEKFEIPSRNCTIMFLEGVEINDNFKEGTVTEN